MIKSLVVHPPYIEKKAASKHVLFAAILYFIIPPIFALFTFALFDDIGVESNLPELKQRTPLSLIYSAFIEEIAFRLPIKKSNWTSLFSSLALALICVPFIIPPNIIVWHILGVLLMALAFVFIERFIHNHCSLSFSFYFYTLLFASLHLVNISYESLTFSVLLFALLYCISKLIDGMFLGFIRIQTNVLLTILLHTTFNVSVYYGPKIIMSICNTFMQ